MTEKDQEKRLKSYVKVFVRLSSLGITDEKKLEGLDTDSLLYEQGISLDELKTISQMKKSVKNRRLFSYLMGGENDE